jgi:hypothetical protein
MITTDFLSCIDGSPDWLLIGRSTMHPRMTGRFTVYPSAVAPRLEEGGLR